MGDVISEKSLSVTRSRAHLQACWSSTYPTHSEKEAVESAFPRGLTNHSKTEVTVGKKVQIHLELFSHTHKYYKGRYISHLKIKFHLLIEIIAQKFFLNDYASDLRSRINLKSK